MPSDDQPISDSIKAGTLTVAGIIKSQSESIGSQPTLSDLATISHQKGDVGLITLSKDKIEGMLSATGSLSSNFLFFVLGAALSVLLALKSGGVEEGSRPIFWLAFVVALILAAFFGAFTAQQELKKKRFRKEIRDMPSTPLR